MLGVATHHQPLQGDRSLRVRLRTTYRTPGDLIAALGHVDPVAAGELHQWLRAETGTAGPAAPGPGRDRPRRALAAEDSHRPVDRPLRQHPGAGPDRRPGAGRGHPGRPRRLRPHRAAPLPASRCELPEVADQPAQARRQDLVPAPAASLHRSRAPAPARPDGPGEDRGSAAVGQHPGRTPAGVDRRDAARFLHPALPGLDQCHERPSPEGTRRCRSAA